MPSNFRFLVICRRAIRNVDNQRITFEGVVNDLTLMNNEGIELVAAIGAVLLPVMEGKRLDLMAWKLARDGERQPIPGYAGTPLILPRGIGALVAPYSIKVPVKETGIFGFDLFDPDGVFGQPEGLLATYMFSVTVELASPPDRKGGCFPNSFLGKSPQLDVRTNTNHSPHVVLLGAGASKAALPHGDANGKRVPVLAELVECVGLAPLLESYGFTTAGQDFEALYDQIASSPEYDGLAKAIQLKIREYFTALTLPDSVTLYDHLVLGLREKDVIASFNWDPFLAQAWKRNSKVAKLPRIIFLHGNVDIGVCLEHRVKNFIGERCTQCGTFVTPVDLLYPVAHKNYTSDPFISAEWAELRSVLREAYFLTLFGYAAPTSDVEAKELLLSVWKNNPLFDLAEIDIINIQPKKTLEKTWQKFFCRQHYGVFRSFRQSYLYRHPRRSCEAFAMATLQQSPWKQNVTPRFDKLENLQDWMRVLYDEENTGTLSGKTCEELLSSGHQVGTTLR